MILLEGAFFHMIYWSVGAAAKNEQGIGNTRLFQLALNFGDILVYCEYCRTLEVVHLSVSNLSYAILIGVISVRAISNSTRRRVEISIPDKS